MRKTIFLLMTAALFISCSNSTLKNENVILNEQITELKGKVILLEKELTMFKMSPDVLLHQAKKHFDDQDFDNLNKVFQNIIEYHPSSEEKNKISSMVVEMKKVIDAREKKRQLELEKEKQERLSVVKRMKKNHDDINGITWYKNPYFTHYDNRNLTSIYIGQKNYAWLRLKMSYTGDNWIFFEKAYLSYDGNTKEIPFDRYENKETENSGGAVWEWIDVSLKDSDIPFLKNLAKSSNAKMRLSGKYTHDRNLSANERKGIADIIMAYEVLNEEKK